MSDIDNKILNLFSLILGKNSHGNQDIVNLYRDIEDHETFLKVVGRFSGRTVKFPTTKEIEEAMVLAMVYYYREQGLSWKEIQAILPVEFSPTGYSMKIKALNSFILKSLKKVMNDEKR